LSALQWPILLMFQRDGTIRPRELTEQFLGGRMQSMKLLDHYEAACTVRRLASRTIQPYRRQVEQCLRFHRDRTGRWIHPQAAGGFVPRWMGELEVEGFLTCGPNSGRDLNCQSCSGERSCVNSAGTSDHRDALLEHDLGAPPVVPTIRKPFDVLGEGLLVSSSRGDWL